MGAVIVMNGEGWPGIEAGAEMLVSGKDPLAVIEEAITRTEAESAVRTVGLGGAPNALGVMQLDASIMDGDTLQTGAVGALEGVLHPISVAREVMRRLPHVMLVGAGAQQFARETGFPIEDILSVEAKAEYLAWRAKNFREPLVELFAPTDGRGCHGTVICLVSDGRGRLCGGVSTSGWDYKYPGRLGDSPIIGAGLYVDSRFGAAACTHTGENAVRTSLARSVVLYMKKGAAVRDAVAEGMDDLRALKGGYQGQVVIYAIDRHGEHFVGRRHETTTETGCRFLIYRPEMARFERLKAEFLG